MEINVVKPSHECIKEGELATHGADIKHLKEYEAKQNGSLQRMEDKVNDFYVRALWTIGLGVGLTVLLDVLGKLFNW